MLAFYSLMPLLYGDADAPATSYVCPMHPEVTSTEPGTCPKCGMKLIGVTGGTGVLRLSDAPGGHATEPGTCPKCGMKLVPERPTDDRPAADDGARPQHDHGDGLEWEDLMLDINRVSDPRTCCGSSSTGRPEPRTERSPGVHRRRPGEDPPRQRDGVRSPDAPPVPHPRCGPFHHPLPGR